MMALMTHRSQGRVAVCKKRHEHELRNDIGQFPLVNSYVRGNLFGNA